VPFTSRHDPMAFSEFPRNKKMRPPSNERLRLLFASLLACFRLACTHARTHDEPCACARGLGQVPVVFYFHPARGFNSFIHSYILHFYTLAYVTYVHAYPVNHSNVFISNHQSIKSLNHHFWTDFWRERAPLGLRGLGLGFFRGARASA